MANPRIEEHRCTFYPCKWEGGRGKRVHFLSNNIMYHICYCGILNQLQRGKVTKYKELGMSMAELLEAILESRRQ